MNTAEKLQKIFEKNGIFVDEDEREDPLEINSLQFVKLLVSIEEEFSIQIDEDYYSGEGLQSFSDFVNMIDGALNQ
ncbi:MAG: hypothetical protein IJT27_03865 [Clostridia bacterium]|nr:hypothetical protein [Clostridia bacterium]